MLVNTNLSIEISIFLFTALLGLVIAKRFGQSAVLLEILLGVIIGPTVLGLVAYNDAIKTLAELGAIFLLFTIGLECNYQEIYNLKNSMVALFGVLVPFFAGWGIAEAFGYNTLEGLFIGVALTATSIAITAHVLKERGVISTPAAKTIIGAAVVDDVLGLIALSIISGLKGNMDGVAIALQIAFAIGFVAACIIMIKPINKLMGWIDEKTKGEEHQLTLFAAMCIAFGYAGVASLLGLSSIVGAFLAGVTLEGVKIKSFREGAVYFEMLFSAIFFISLGVIADIQSLNGVWLFAIVLIAVAILTKMIGCVLPAKAAGHTWKDSFTIGFGMVPRGEVAMIVALMGLTAGVISQQVYAVILLMAFATTIATPLFLQWSLAAKD
jgi:Kef-type K+ transport system membrane component KefB